MLQALLKVNEAREAYGLEALDRLPQGKRMNEEFCPIALALSEGDGHVSAGISNATFDDRDYANAAASVWLASASARTSYTVPYPHEIRSFIRRFDIGDFPELDGDVL
jgi:hypothetical protein